MVLIDTSVWVEHFRSGHSELVAILDEGQAACHPFIIGELACGNLKNRQQILSLLAALPCAYTAEHDEVMHVIEKFQLMGKGLGYIDVHLLASALLSNIGLLTLDKRLATIASTLSAKK